MKKEKKHKNLPQSPDQEVETKDKEGKTMSMTEIKIEIIAESKREIKNKREIKEIEEKEAIVDKIKFKFHLNKEYIIIFSTMKVGISDEINHAPFCMLMILI